MRESIFANVDMPGQFYCLYLLFSWNRKGIIFLIVVFVALAILVNVCSVVIRIRMFARSVWDDILQEAKIRQAGIVTPPESPTSETLQLGGKQMNV
jgi:hypothetical protein